MPKIIVSYTTETEKEALKATHPEKYLIEEQDHEDGKFLVFDDNPLPDNEPTFEERLAALETLNANLETRLANVEAAKL